MLVAYAQGGIAAIVSSDDSIEAHINDIYITSSKVAKLESITQVVKNSNTAIAWLEKHGVEFDRNPNGQYSLHLEGEYSQAMIIHIKDYTGRAVITSLNKNLNNFKNINIYAEHNVIV